MSLHTSPESHARNSPDTWHAVKVGPRRWGLLDADGKTLETFDTRREALEAIRSSWVRSEWEREGQWYAGHNPAGWRPWAEVEAERVAWEAKNGRPAPWL